MQTINIRKLPSWLAPCSVAKLIATVVGLTLFVLLIFSGLAQAAPLPITKISPPDPIPGSYGLAAVKVQPAPKQAPSITTPGNGSSFSTSPIEVSGICSNNLLVEIFDNGVFVGSVVCKNGSFSIKISLFQGKNIIKAIQYDSLDQASPASNTVTLNFNNANFQSLNPTIVNQLVTLTSNYGRRAAPPGSNLTWPLQLSGGTGPYAFSTDWGDNTQPSLKSVSLAGNVTIDHTYKKSGIYIVTIRVTDKNGASAFLQVVAVASGKVSAAGNSGAKPSKGNEQTNTVVKVLWIPVLILLILLVPAYWLGRKSQVISIRRRLEKDMDNYKEV